MARMIKRQQTQIHNKMENVTSPITPPMEEHNMQSEILCQQTNEAVRNLQVFSYKAVIFQKTYEDKAVQVDNYEDFKKFNVTELVDSGYKW